MNRNVKINVSGNAALYPIFLADFSVVKLGERHLELGDFVGLPHICGKKPNNCKHES